MSNKRKKEIITKTWTLDKRIVHNISKGKVHIMNFKKGDLLKGVLIKKKSFSTQEVGRKIIFPLYLRNLYDIWRTEKDDLSVVKETIRWYLE